jgi:peptide/nickel transport system permease protein
MRLVKYYWGRTKKNKLAVVGLGFIVFLVAVALFGPFFTLSPTLANFDETNIPPLGFSTSVALYNVQTGQTTENVTNSSWKHPLGTDAKGRDLLAMLVSGARISLWVGLLATGLSILIGTAIGIAAAYFGKWVDNVLMRFTEIMMTFPFFLLLVFLVFIFGPSLGIIVLVIGLTGWTGASRLIRSEALSLRTRDFVTASRALGARDTWVMFRHLLPNVISLIIVMATLSIPGVILAESGLSFIGLGDPTVPSWGVILKD